MSPMLEALLVLFLLALNIGISWWNAWAIGRVWVAAKAAGGFARVVAISAAAMSACGFTWAYAVVLALALSAFGILPTQVVRLVLDFVYVAMVIPALGAGLVLTVHSWRNAMASRRAADVGVAGYNTVVQVFNTVQAARGFPKALGEIARSLKGGSKESKAAVLALLLAILALIGGMLTTRAILYASARAHGVPVRRWRLGA